MHVGAIGGDEQQDEGIIRSRALAAMGTDAGRRGCEVVVDPTLDGRLRRKARAVADLGKRC
jgi:hypothetical protein